MTTTGALTTYARSVCAVSALLAQDPLHSIRPTHDVTSTHTRHCFAITRWQLPRVRYFRIRRWSCVRDNPSRRAAFVLFPRQSCRTFAIVVRSTTLRSVVSLRSDLAPDCRRQMVRVDERAFTENRGPLQHIAKLSNVARPVVLEKRLSCLARQTSGWPAEGPADLLQKRLAQRNDVGRTLAQRRNLDVEDAEAVEQVLAKVAALDGFPQVAVGRGDHPDVRLQEARPAEPLELALLQHAQELRLRGQAHLADLVEEQHAARRQLHLARAWPAARS